LPEYFSGKSPVDYSGFIVQIPYQTVYQEANQFHILVGRTGKQIAHFYIGTLFISVISIVKKGKNGLIALRPGNWQILSSATSPLSGPSISGTAAHTLTTLWRASATLPSAHSPTAHFAGAWLDLIGTKFFQWIVFQGLNCFLYRSAGANITFDPGMAQHFGCLGSYLSGDKHFSARLDDHLGSLNSSTLGEIPMGWIVQVGQTASFGIK
jgi:hypothetical protein